MKNFITSLLLAAGVTLTASAQERIYLVKDGNVVSSYALSDVDYITFSEPQSPDDANAVGLPYYESFAQSLGQCTNYTTNGSGEWINDFSTAKATGYNNNTKVTTAGTYYLVTPPLSLKDVSDATVTYSYILRYNKGDENQQLLITSKFNESHPAEGWEVLNSNHVLGSDWNTFSNASISIPEAYLGKTVRIALRYNTNDVSGSTWEVKNLRVSSSSNTVPAAPLARMETPAVLNNGTTQVITHNTTVDGREVMTYEMEYDLTKLHSRWIAFRFDGDTRATAVKRGDNFQDDPQLSASYHIGSKGFGNGYDRGHLCASGDRLYSRAANDQTFYMSNMSPQLHDFNQYWTTLEGLVQNKGRNASFSDTLYVVKGGTINDDQIGGYVTRSNGLKVPIPKYYYMALLKVKNGRYSSIGFWMEHKSYGGSSATMAQVKSHAVSVNDLEKLTGINFFPNLPDSIEETVEDELTPSDWGL